MKTKTYEVLTPMRHDGESIEAGEPIELSEKEAAPLLACGAIRDPDSPQPEAGSADAAPVDDAGAAEATREEQIAAAIQAMLSEDPDKTRDEWWTRSGKPEVRAIEQRLGFDLSAAERDAAWKGMS